MHKLIGMATALLVLPIAAPARAELVHSDRQVSDQYLVTDEYGTTCEYQSVIDTYVETSTGETYTVQEEVNLGCGYEEPVPVDPYGAPPFDSAYGEPIPVDPTYGEPVPVDPTHGEPVPFDPYNAPVPFDPIYEEPIPGPEFGYN
jgi:hypothetical protein